MTTSSNNLWALQPEAVADVFGLLGQAQPQADVSTPAPHAGPLGYDLVDGVAVIRVSGPLDRQAHYGWITGGRLATGYDEIAAAVDAATADRAARAIVLAFNSPGGAVPGCKELADHIAATAAQKPMAAYADGLCASAAYWLASATGSVFAPATATVGSIGVVMVHADVSRAWEKAGIHFSYITGGKYKAVGNAETPLTDEDRAYLTGHVSALHTIFREDVAQHMGLALDQAHSWGDGQIFDGRSAHERGLVSGIVSGLPEAVTHLAEDTAMDRATLAAQHPELLAEMENEARTAQEQAVTQAREEATADVLALVEAALGADARAKMDGLIQAKVTPAQLAAMSALFGQPQAQQPVAAEMQPDAKQQILDNLTQAHTGPLPDSAAAPMDEARAAIARMAKM